MIPVLGYSQSITVTNPHSGDVWYKGNSAGYVIRWTKSGTMNANVKIRLYRGEERVVAIVDSTPNDGEYRWVIPSDVSEGTYKIRVKTVDNEVFDDSEEFVIREGSPPEDRARIVVTSPHNGDVWHKGNSAGYVIRWTKRGAMNANVKIRLYRGKELISRIVDNTPNDGEYRWVIPREVGVGKYKIMVKTVDNAVFNDSAPFTIAQSLPTEIITVTSPHSGNSWQKGYSHTIRWTTNGSMDSNVNIKLYQSDGETLERVIASRTSNDGEYSWYIPNSVSSGEYIIKITTMDNEVYRNSAVFNIIRNLSRSGFPQMRDFELKDIRFTFTRGGWVTAKIKNRINAFRGDLKFKVTVLTRRPETFYITKSLNMRAEEEKTIRLLQKDRLGEITSCGKIVRVDIDPDNRFREMNEENNSIGKLIYPKVVDLSIEISDFHWRREDFKPSHKWRVMFKIHVKADGEGFDSLSGVKVRWSVYDGEREIYGYDYVPTTLNLGESRVLEVSKIFGAPGQRYSVKPKLRAGRRYNVRVRISRERTCDKNNKNNLDSHGLRLR
jgi:5-hydroxyisourate hydrolase-like protein (transthyretin family)